MDGPSSRSPCLVRAALALTLLFCLVLGVVCIHEYRSCPFSTAPIIDEEGYVSWARNIVAGHVVGKDVFYQDPLYPYFLAGVFRLFGEHYDLVRLIQAVLGAAAAGLIFLAARRLLSIRAALVAAAALALCHGLYFFEVQLGKESLIIFFSALSLYLGALAADRPDAVARWARVGASLGLLSLLRGNMLLLIPVLAAWAIWAGEKGRGVKGLGRAGLKRAVPLLVGAAAVLAPVTVRNYAVSGELVLSTSQGGPNFFLGNNPAAQGEYTYLPYIFGNPHFEAKDFQKEAERRLGRALTRSEVSRFWYGQGWQWIKENPGAAARLWLRKAWLLVSDYEVPDNQSFALLRDRFVPALWVPLLGPGVLWGPALLGLIVLVRRDRRGLYPALFSLAYCASIIPFYIMDRYRAPLLPVLAILSAALFDRAWEAARKREWSRIVPAAAMVAVAGTVGMWPVRLAPSHYATIYDNLAASYLDLGRPADALPCSDLALEAMPGGIGFRDTWNDAVAALSVRDVPLLLREAGRKQNGPPRLYAIAWRLEQLGRPGLAAMVYQEILDTTPGYFPARIRLFVIYAASPGLADPQKAREELDRARAARPDFKFTGEYDQALRALSDLLLRDGDTTRAAKVEGLRRP